MSTDDDDLTPIGGTPTFEGLDRRIRQTLEVSQQSLVASEECTAETKATRTELAEHRKHDEEALETIHAELGEQRRLQSDGMKKIDRMQEQLIGIAATAARADGALAVLVADVDARREVEVERQLAIVRVDETGQRLQLEDDADKKKARRGLVKKIIGGIVTFLVGAGTAYLGFGG